MAFEMASNMVPDEAADWGQYSVASTCPWPRAQRLAMRDPDIRAFFVCRTGVRLKGRTFAPGDAVFVRSACPLKPNPSCDTYGKGFFNVAYLDPRHVPLRHVGTVRLHDDHRPFFDIACLFAVSIHGAANDVRLAFNGQLEHTLNHTDDVAALQRLGITVLLSVMGDWGDAGWSKFTDPAAAEKFAKLLVDMVDKYGFDGIDVDDEYSLGQGNYDSLIMVTSKVRELAPGIIISKALWQDSGLFKHVWNGKTMAQQLTYGWEMTYWNTSGTSRLTPYTDDPPKPEMRMQKHQLALGVRHGETSDDGVVSQTREIKQQSYGGMMICGVEDIPYSTPIAGLISGELFGQQVELNRLGCWGLPTGALALVNSADASGEAALHFNVAPVGEAFGAPIAVQAANSDRQEVTAIGSAMTAFKDRLWFSWIGPRTKTLDATFLNVCPATFDPEKQQLTFGKKKVFDDLPRGAQPPASAVFNGKLYVAWADSAGSLQLLSGDGEDAWRHEGTIAGRVTNTPALAAIGGRLCLVAADGAGLFAMRSEDGVVFKDRTPIEATPRDVAVTLDGDWIYLACLADGDGKAIQVWRSQDGLNYERFLEAVQTSQACAGVRIATLGPDFYIVARESTGGLRLWFTVVRQYDILEFADRGLLPSITSAGMPSLMALS
jgi:hypothetical protein